MKKVKAPKLKAFVMEMSLKDLKNDKKNGSKETMPESKEYMRVGVSMAKKKGGKGGKKGC